MSVNAFQDEIDRENADRKMRMLQVFLNDVMNDPALADLLPEDPEYLDFFARGSRPDTKPDFQTPNVDVYILSRADLHSNHSQIQGSP